MRKLTFREFQLLTVYAPVVLVFIVLIFKGVIWGLVGLSIQILISIISCRVQNKVVKYDFQTGGL